MRLRASRTRQIAKGELAEYELHLDDKDFRMETCLMLGDEAEFWVSHGTARYISKEEALELLRRNRDDGLIIQSVYGKDTEVICSCHSAVCDNIALCKAFGSLEEVAQTPMYKQLSHYTLEVDFDSCIKCGTCANRCPLEAITMDGPDGTPQVSGMCWRCGQCAYVCPQHARALVVRPDDEILELPQNMVDGNNMKAAFRFEHGMIA